MSYLVDKIKVNKTTLLFVSSAEKWGCTLPNSAKQVERQGILKDQHIH